MTWAALDYREFQADLTPSPFLHPEVVEPRSVRSPTAPTSSESRCCSSSSSSRMNLGSKSKKRVVLPSRPNPPTVEQILEDINGAAPSDPAFTLLERTGQDSPRPSPDSDTELKFQQCRRYLEVNERLQEVRAQLLRQREELQAAGGRLDADVAEVRAGAL